MGPWMMYPPSQTSEFIPLTVNGGRVLGAQTLICTGAYVARRFTPGACVTTETPNICRGPVHRFLTHDVVEGDDEVQHVEESHYQIHQDF